MGACMMILPCPFVLRQQCNIRALALVCAREVAPLAFSLAFDCLRVQPAYASCSNSIARTCSYVIVFSGGASWDAVEL